MSNKIDPLCQINLRMVKSFYGERFFAVTELLALYDPLGLIALGAPSDEYDPEAKTIMVQLDDAESVEDLHNIIYTEFVRWFDKSIAGEKEKYHPIAIEIFRLKAE